MVTLPSPFSMGPSFATRQLEAREGGCGVQSTQGGCVWEGVSPSTLGNGSGELAQPLPRKVLEFQVENGTFWCIPGAIYADCSNLKLYGLLRCTAAHRRTCIEQSAINI